MAKVSKGDGKREIAFEHENMKIIIPDTFSMDEKEREREEYIQKLVDNIDLDEIKKNEEENKSDGIESEDKNKEPNETQEEKDEFEKDIITDYEEENTEENEESQTKKRKLTIIDKSFIALLVAIPLIQWVLITILPANIFFIVSGISFVLIAILSYFCNQYYMLFVELILIIVSVTIPICGISHGLKAEDLTNKTIVRIMYLNDNMSKKTEFNDYSDEEITSKLSGQFIYYYKYGCKDCLATEGYIKSIAKKNGYEVIPVETRSKFGKRLRESYPVEEVPAGLVIKENGEYVAKVLYTQDDKGNSIPYEPNMKAIIDTLNEMKGDK